MYGVVFKMLIKSLQLASKSKFLNVAAIVASVAAIFGLDFGDEDFTEKWLNAIKDGIEDGTIMIPKGWQIEERGLPAYLVVDLEKERAFMTNNYYSKKSVDAGYRRGKRSEQRWAARKIHGEAIREGVG